MPSETDGLGDLEGQVTVYGESTVSFALFFFDHLCWFVVQFSLIPSRPVESFFVFSVLLETFVP